MKQDLPIVTEDTELNRIFFKAHFLEEAENSLAENSMKFLMLEKIDEKEAEKVEDALAASREQISKVVNYLNGLKTKGLDLKSIPSITKMLKDLSKAVDKAQADFAAANFKKGAVSKFMGNTMTAPGIVKGAIAIQSKASKFLTGFTDALQNIEKNLVPLSKNSDKKTPLRDLAGQGPIPSEEDLEKAILDAMKDALETKGMLSKIGNFLSKNMPTAKGKILKSIPDLNVSLAARELTNAFMDSPLSIFDAADIKDTKIGLKDLADVAKSVVTDTKGEKDFATGTAAAPGTAGEEPAPASEEEAEEEQAEAEKELKAAVEEEAKEAQTPKDAAFGALDGWASSLSQTSQKSLKAKNRLGDLKDVIEMALDDSVKAVEGQVAAAIQSWRDDHEETLIKSRRFAKKNFDDLEKMISSLAATMLKKANESKIKMSASNIQKIVFEMLNRKFYKNSDHVLSESKISQVEKDLIVYRVNKLAGLE